MEQNDFYLHNIKLLEKRFPGIQHQLEEAREQELENREIVLIPARSGDLTGRCGGKFLHSRFDPAREAHKLIDAHLRQADGKRKSRNPMLFEGFGLGYHVEAYLDRESDHSVLVLEPSAQRFITALTSRSMDRLLLDERLCFLIACEPGALEQLFPYPTDPIYNYRLRPLYEADPDSFIPFDEMLKSILQRREVNEATLERFANRWTSNLFRNRMSIADADPITDLHNACTGLPVLLVAAGPSLDDLFSRIPDIHHKFVVIAVDTAARALRLHRIQADFMMVVDPQYWNCRHLDNAETDQIILVSESSTHPAILRKSWRRIYFSSSMFPLGMRFEEDFEGKMKLDAGGSVSTTAFSLARFLGAREIFCIGLDLGYPGNRTHYRGSFFEERSHAISQRLSPFEGLHHKMIHSAGAVTIPAYSGSPLASDSRLAVYRDWFSSRVQLAGTPKCYSLSSDSAAIEGIHSIDIEKITKLPDIRRRKSDIISSLSSRSPADRHRRRKAVRKVSHELRQELERICSFSAEAEILAIKSAKLIDKGRRDELGRNAQLLSEIDRSITSNASKELVSFLIQPYLKRIESSSPGSNGFTQSSELYREIRKSAEYYLKLLDG